MARIVDIVSGPWKGQTGEVVGQRGEALRVQVGKRVLLVHPSDARDVPASVKGSAESPLDFDRGFGIGGLGRFEETPIIPSVQAIEREQRMMDTDVVCRKCGASMNFDGAMFTNGGGDICDDCF